MNSRHEYLAKQIGYLYRSFQNKATNDMYVKMDSIFAAAADICAETPDERETFLRIMEEAEIAGD